MTAGVLWVLGDEDERAGAIDWISTQTDAVAARVRDVSDSIEARTSSSGVGAVPSVAAPPASSARQASVSDSEASRRSPQSVAANDADTEQSGRYPGEGPLNSADVERWIVRFTNDEREKAGLKAFVHDPAIADIARAHSENMVRYGMSHELRGKDPTDRALEAGYDCRAFHGDGSYSYGLSENIAEHPRVTYWSGVGFGGGPTRWMPVEFDADSHAMALGLVRGWMESPGHRANILDGESRKTGVGVAISEAPDNGWTHETVFAAQNFCGCR